MTDPPTTITEPKTEELPIIESAGGSLGEVSDIVSLETGGPIDVVATPSGENTGEEQTVQDPNNNTEEEQERGADPDGTKDLSKSVVATEVPGTSNDATTPLVVDESFIPPGNYTAKKWQPDQPDHQPTPRTYDEESGMNGEPAADEEGDGESSIKTVDRKSDRTTNLMCGASIVSGVLGVCLLVLAGVCSFSNVCR